MNIQERYDEVKRFNEIGGNLVDVDLKKLEAQMKVFVEESKETADAFENKDSVELLDGICDSFVTLVGLMQMAEKLGFKVDDALERVNENNLSKFTPASVSAIVVPEDYHVTVNQEYNVLVLKDKNGKIRKPPGFAPVQIDDLAVDVFGAAA